MSFCSTIYGNLPESGFVYTATSVSVDNGSFENLSATNATIVNLETTTFNPTNVDCTTLTADNASITNISGTNMTLDNLSVTNYDITTLQATTANISTINSSIINSSHSNLSTIGTFRINISEASDPALASVIRRDANNFLFEGRVDPTDPHATILFFTTEEGAGYGPTLQMNLSNVDIRNLSGDKLTYTNASIDNLSSTNIVASGAIDAFSMEASLLTATSNLATPFVNTSDLQTQLINSSQINASNISTRNLSAVLQITSTFIDATNRMSAPTLNTLVNNVSIVNASTINSQIGNFSTTNISNNNVSSLFVKRSTGGKATIDMTTTQVLDIDGGFLDAGNVTARGVTIRAGNEVSPAISVGNDNGVVITNLSSVNFETDNISCDIADITTGNVSTLNVSTLNASVKNASTMNSTTINCSTMNSSFCNALVVDSSIVKSTIYELEDGSGGGGSNGVISESANELTIRTGASGGVTKFGTTSGGNFSVQIANDALNASTINSSQVNATDIDATTIDADTITGDIGGNLAAGSGISLSTTAGVTTISNTGGSVTDPLNLSKLNVSNISCDNTIESANSKATIFEVADSSGLGGQPNGYIYETANVMTLRTGASGGVIEFGTTYGGNFSVNIAGDALNASTANISTINSNTGNIGSINASVVNSDFLNGNIANNLTAGTNITLSTTGGVTTINSAGGSVSDPLNLSTLNASTGNIAALNTSIINSDFINGNIANNLTAGTGISLSTTGGVTTISNTGGSVTDPLNLSKLNVSNVSCDNTIESANSKATIFEVADSSGLGGQPNGFIYETANVMTLRTGAVGGVIEFGTTYGGNFSVQIANDALNASTANISTANINTTNISTINASTITATTMTGDISPNLTAGTGISLSTTTGVTTINNTATGTSIQYGWCASSTLTGTSTLGSGTILQFDTLSGNANRDFEAPSGVTNYSTTGYYYEVAVSGYYSVGFNLYTLNTETTAITAVVKDVIGARGTYLTIGESGQDTRSNEDCKMIAYFDVGDRIYVRSSTGIVLNWVNSATFFYGFLLSGSSQLSTSTQYAWRASSTSSGTASLSAGTRINYNSITNNAVRDFESPSGAGNYKTGTQEYQAPVEGYYLIGFNILVNNGSTDCQVNLKKTTSGGTTSALAQSGKQNKSTEDCITISYLDVGDKVFVEVVSGTISLDYNTAGTYFYGNLLQPENNTITDTTDLTTNSLKTSLTNVSNSNISNLTIDNNLNGYAFIRTIAIAKVLANGTNVKTVGCTISRSATGRYGCTLDVARPSSNYCVQLTVMEDNSTLDDVIISITQGSMTTTGFLFVIMEQDNGASPGSLVDRNCMVTIFDTD